MYDIQDGILFLDIECQSITIVNEVQDIILRYKNIQDFQTESYVETPIDFPSSMVFLTEPTFPIDFPSSMVFLTEPTLLDIILKNKIYYVIISNKLNQSDDQSNLYQAILRAISYKKNPGLSF
jgi:hypothetical protein